MATVLAQCASTLPAAVQSQRGACEGMARELQSMSEAVDRLQQENGELAEAAESAAAEGALLRQREVG